MRIKMPLGVEFFEEIMEDKSYYVDKTGFIKELLSESFKVNLITRPRRFGKTLAMTMLDTFFNIRKNSTAFFAGLEIAQELDLCSKWMNQWPVLFLTLKDVEGNTFEDAYEILKNVIASLCIDHRYLSDSEAVDAQDKAAFLRLKAGKGSETDIKSSLFLLTRIMADYYGKQVILLIDEYDVPLAKANDNGYYQEMLNIIRSLLGRTWKTNAALKFAVVTGCLRIAKESIFTGANNFVAHSIAEKLYSHYFGFTQQEVCKLLEDMQFSEYLPQIKKWYDGYVFGGTEIYCPWDVVNYVSTLKVDPQALPGSYWKSTSHNNIIRKFIDIKDIAVNDKFEILINGGVIQENIVEDLTYDLDSSSEANLWSILYLTGYLTQTPSDKILNTIKPEPEKMMLCIPNEEVKTIFVETVAKWFTDTVAVQDRSAFFAAWWNGKDKELSKQVTDILFDTISYFDYKEDYYHAFVAGLFAGAGYAVSSNSEQGTGRADILVKDRRNRRAIIIEVKRSKTEKRMPKDCEAALEQIDREKYTIHLLKGYKTILCYGAAFFEKSCIIKYSKNKERNSS